MPPRRLGLRRAAGERAGAVRLAARRAQMTRGSPPAGRLDEQHDRLAARRLVHGGHGLAGQQFGQRRRVHDPPHHGLVGVDAGRR